MQSTINQLKHGKGRAVRDNGTRGVVSIDRGVAECYIAISTTPLVPLLRTYSTSFRALTITCEAMNAINTCKLVLYSRNESNWSSPQSSFYRAFGKVGHFWCDNLILYYSLTSPPPPRPHICKCQMYYYASPVFSQF